MNDLPRSIQDRIRDLREERLKILSLSPEKALDRILEAPHPAALVHSMPDEDYYFLIHDIGREDALPILSLASDAQLEYILDIEGWHRDRIQLPALTQWMERMLQAQPQRFASWLAKQHTDLMMYFFNRNTQIVMRDHDEDPSDLGDDFFTFDDVFYVRMLPDLSDTGSTETEEGSLHQENEERRFEFIKKLLNRLANDDYHWYQQLMINTVGLLSVESEEELYRLRNVRLAEKGFLPFEEAIGIYQPVSPEKLVGKPAKVVKKRIGPVETFPIPQYPVALLDRGNPFSEALVSVNSEMILAEIQVEFAALCNRIIAADQQLIQDRAQLHEIVRKACGYLSIGLEAIGKATNPLNSGTPSRLWAEFVTRYPLGEIFQVGYGQALRLKWQVKTWQKNAWFTSMRLPLSFWGEVWMGILGGLLIKKPLFFDNYQSGKIYREYASADDIAATEKAVNQIMEMDNLFSRLKLRFRTDVGAPLNFKSLLLTSWAHHHLHLPESENERSVFPLLTREEFRQFFKELFDIGTDDPSRTPRKIGKSMKASFLNWLYETSHEAVVSIIEQVGPTLDALFDEIDTELGTVPITALDPRFILLFQVK